MTWVEKVMEACDSQKGWVSRPAIKAFLTKNHGYVDNGVNKNHLKKALAKFTKKGDSYKTPNTLRKGSKNAEKKAAAKAKAAARKQLSLKRATDLKLGTQEEETARGVKLRKGVALFLL